MHISRALTLSFAVLFAACSPQPHTHETQSTHLPELPAIGEATEATRSAQNALAARLDLESPSDGVDARRGRLSYIEYDAIRNDAGDVIWAIPQFDFLNGEAPDTVNPSLWRQAALAAEHGLFEVQDGIYQVRGYDLAVMSVIAGDTGWIIVDPLTTAETASASLALVNETLGERPVTGVLYTHSHADHFGGVRGVISEEDIAERNVPVLAPIGFSESAVAENLLAGGHMARRSAMMFGSLLPRDAGAHISSGLGPGLPQGAVGLILPTEEISGRGTTRFIDGVEFEFIDAAGTEAPAEFMFYLPEHRALCTAEVATATFHNVLTPRGAKVRDALGWSQAIDYVLAEYGEQSDVVFASHHWPTWGNENVTAFLSGQRDIYRYVHDQTLRLANDGGTMVEIAEAIPEPAVQSEAFHTRSYYGTLNHNSKAVYQNYFGWWGGVPAEYNALPHTESAARYVAAMGGAEAVLSLGTDAFENGEYRWAAEVLNHLVFADPSNETARSWLAATYDQLGFQAESGAWRSYYLTGAQELRNGAPELGVSKVGGLDFVRAVPTLDLFDAMATRYNPALMTQEPFAIEYVFPDTSEIITLHIGRDVMVPRITQARGDEETETQLTMNRSDFDLLMAGLTTPPDLMAEGKMQIAGNPAALAVMFGALETPDPWFNTVTP